MILLGMNSKNEREIIEWSGTIQELIDSNMYPDMIWYSSFKNLDEVKIFQDQMKQNKISEVWY